MMPTRSVALLAVLAVVGLTVAPLASGSVANPFAQAETGTSETSEPAGTNASVGTLMQASAADAENTVESGMFEAAYERADDERRSDVVRERTAELETELADLEAERARLQSDRENLTRGAYRSRMAKLTVETAGLERSIDRTERRAVESGVAEDRISALRENATSIRRAASEHAGANVSAIARGLSDAGGPGFAAGPPDDRGRPDDPGRSKTDGEPGNGPEKRSSGTSPAAADRPPGPAGGGPTSEFDPGTADGSETGSTGNGTGGDNGTGGGNGTGGSNGTGGDNGTGGGK